MLSESLKEGARWLEAASPNASPWAETSNIEQT